MEHDMFAERGHALEEEYFRRKDRELVEKMRMAAATERARGEIGRKIGLKDPALLQELLDLGFTPDTVALLPIVPVLEVAWAEGGITDAERDRLVKLARSRGIEANSAADLQLTQWMTSSPDPAVFQRAGRLIAAMLASDSYQKGFSLTADELVAYCEQIAAASGGIFGTTLRSVTAEERSLLTRIASDIKARQR